jgi:osmoprotectant transport system substrate-binding protein
VFKKMWALFAAFMICLGVTACGGDDSGDTSAGGGGSTSTQAAADDQPGKGKPAVTLGAKNFTEQFILGELYKQALEAKGWTVNLKSNIGATEVTDKALTSGKIDMYPEYTGTILSVVKGQTDVPASADETYQQAKAFMNGRGFELLEQTPFEDRDALAVTKKFSDANGGLKTTSDLKPLGAKVTVGAAPEFRTRFAGLKGLKSEYGLSKLKFKPLAIGLNYQALDQNRVQAADVFTTDGQLASGKYVVLEDPKGIFGYQNVAPVVSKKVLDAQGPEFSDTLDAVSKLLSNEAMQKMNSAAAVDKQKPEAIAKQFLQANGLV